MSLSDFPCPSIIGVRHQTSRCDPPHHLGRVNRGSPSFCAKCFRACSGSSTPQGPSPSRDSDGPDVAFRLPRGRRHPKRRLFRSSIPGLHVPLSTLHPRPRGQRRMTRRTRWIAIPSLCKTFTRYTSPAYWRFPGGLSPAAAVEAAPNSPAATKNGRGTSPRATDGRSLSRHLTHSVAEVGHPRAQSQAAAGLADAHHDV